MSVKVLQDARMKAAPPETAVGTRTLDFYAAAFSTVPDKNGDIIDPHACDEWLANFYKTGKPLPISFAHAAVRNDMNPFEIIGYAPADADHVWVDDYGLRVKAYLDVGENDTARQVASLVDRFIVTGASIAFIAVREKRRSDGSALITKMQILEAGPCLTPANEEAVVMGLKVTGNLDGDDVGRKIAEYLLRYKADDVQTVEAENVQTTEIEAETTVADTEPVPPETPDAPDPETPTLSTDERKDVLDALALAAETKHGGAPAHLQTAHDALVRAGAKCSHADPEVAAKASGPDDYALRVRRLKLLRTTTT